MTYSLEFDIAHDCPMSVLDEMVDKYGLIGYECVDPCGPGGGNPIFKFTAKSEIELEGFAVEEMCYGDVAEYEELHKPYMEKE